MPGVQITEGYLLGLNPPVVLKKLQKYPVNKITNVYAFDKYGIEASSTLVYWSIRH
jgi:hypothetical protein